jgi:PAS domain S-box-containing protein
MEMAMPHNEKILIVDDECRMSGSLKDLLSTRGYEIKTCGNGHDALKCLIGDSFDLVLLDIAMEGMDGFQVMERMARQHLDIPVIIMTGNASTASAVEALRKGAYDYLRKPFEPEELFTSVKNALNQRTLKKDNYRVKRKLRESERRLQSILDRSGTVVFLKDLEGRYILVNRLYEERFHVTRQTIVGKSDFALFPPEQAGQFQQHDLLALEKGGPIEVEEVVLQDDGPHVYISVKFPLFSAEGNPYAICGIATDITERKRAEVEKAELEAQNRQLQKAESLSRMAGAIAHNFNNQLMVVMGNLELAMETPPPGGTSGKNLAEAMKAARRVAEVSGLMLTYLGQTTAKQEPMDLCAVCRRSLPLLRAALPETILLKANFLSPGLMINGNSNQMQQVLTNLIVNAGESCDGQGSIQLNVKTVSAGNIPGSHRYPIDWHPQATAYACLEVRDPGCGIAEKDIDKIFDPFFTSKFPGRGLGLAVVLGILRVHHGGITAESEPGRGSVFRVFLPVSAG